MAAVERTRATSRATSRALLAQAAPTDQYILLPHPRPTTVSRQRRLTKLQKLKRPAKFKRRLPEMTTADVSKLGLTSPRVMIADDVGAWYKANLVQVDDRDAQPGKVFAQFIDYEPEGVVHIAFDDPRLWKGALPGDVGGDCWVRVSPEGAAYTLDPTQLPWLKEVAQPSKALHALHFAQGKRSTSGSRAPSSSQRAAGGAPGGVGSKCARHNAGDLQASSNKRVCRAAGSKAGGEPLVQKLREHDYQHVVQSLKDVPDDVFQQLHWQDVPCDTPVFNRQMFPDIQVVWVDANPDLSCFRQIRITSEPSSSSCLKTPSTNKKGISREEYQLDSLVQQCGLLELKQSSIVIDRGTNQLLGVFLTDEDLSILKGSETLLPETFHTLSQREMCGQRTSTQRKCDHGDLILYGFRYRMATPPDRDTGNHPLRFGFFYIKTKQAVERLLTERKAAQRALQQATSLLYKCEKLVSPAMAQYRLDTAKQYGFPSIVPPFKQPLARMPAQFIALSYGYMTGPHVDGVTSLPAQPGMTETIMWSKSNATFALFNAGVVCNLAASVNVMCMVPASQLHGTGPSAVGENQGYGLALAAHKHFGSKDPAGTVHSHIAEFKKRWHAWTKTRDTVKHPFGAAFNKITGAGL